jgi:hypothetical protein
MVAQISRFSHYFQGRLCKLPLLRAIFNGKLGDYYAICRTLGEQCKFFRTDEGADINTVAPALNTPPPLLL